MHRLGKGYKIISKCLDIPVSIVGSIISLLLHIYGITYLKTYIATDFFQFKINLQFLKRDNKNWIVTVLAVTHVMTLHTRRGRLSAKAPLI